MSDTKSNHNIEYDDLINTMNTHNDKLPWSKLDNYIKCKKIEEYITTIYSPKNKLNNEDTNELISYLKTQVFKKRVQIQKGVIYDIEKGQITDIQTIVKNSNKFTLKSNVPVNLFKNLTPKKNVTVKKKKPKKIVPV